MSLPVEKKQLKPPLLEELAKVIAAGLQTNFERSSCVVESCTDLRKAPFHLAAEGLGGSPRIADTGSPSNLRPPNLSKKYDLLEIGKLMELPSSRGALLGAGAGPFYVVGKNCELAPNVAYENGKVTNLTHFTKIEGDEPQCHKIEGSTGFALMSNLFGSEGRPGPALHIKATSRTGKHNFTDAIQAAIRSHYGTDMSLLSMGGVFVIKRGRANLHVMPDFQKEEMTTDEHIWKWLKYFEFDAPLVCLSVLHTGDQMGLDLRTEHTHCFSDSGRSGGHYHYDVEGTKDVVDYEGWFNTAEWVYRIDRPQTS